MGGNGALRNISGTNSYAGAITLAAATTIQSDAATLTLSGGITGATLNLTVEGAGDTTISGVIGTTTGTLTKNDAGTLILSGANTYTGTTTINAGTLQLGAAGVIADGSAVTVAGGIFDLNGNNETVASLTVTSGSATTGTGTLTTTNNLQIDSGSITATTGSLDVNGNVLINGGTLTAPSGNFNVFGTWTKTGGTFTNNGGTVVFDGTGTQTVASDSSAFNNVNTTGKTAGALNFTDSVSIAGTLTTSANNFNVSILNGGTIATTSISHTGSITIGDADGDTTNFNNGLNTTTTSAASLWGTINTTNSTLNFVDATTINGTSVTLDTGAGAGNVTFSGTLNGAADLTQDLTIAAGTGTVNFNDLVGTTNRLRDVLINSSGTLTIDASVSGAAVTIGEDEAGTTDTFLARTLKTNAAGIGGQIVLGGTGGLGGDIILTGVAATNSLDIQSNVTAGDAIFIHANITVAAGDIVMEATDNGEDIRIDIVGLPNPAASPGTNNADISTRTVSAPAGSITTLVAGGGARTRFLDDDGGGTSSSPTAGKNTIFAGFVAVSADQSNFGNNLDDGVFPHIASAIISLSFTGDLELGDDAIGAVGALAGNFITDATMDGFLGNIGTTLIIDVTTGNIILDRANPFKTATGTESLTLITDGLITDASAAGDGDGLAFQSSGTLTLTSAGTIGTTDLGGVVFAGGNADNLMRIDVGTLIITSTGMSDVNITDTGAVNGDTIFNISTGGAGDITISKLAGNMILNGISTTGNLIAATTNGTITDTAAVSVTSNATFNDVGLAGITLDTLEVDANVILTAAGDTSITNDTVLNLEGAVTGTLGATATAGGITDSGNLSVTGDATFTDTATAGITLGTLQADSNVILVGAGVTSITNDTVLNLEGDVTGTLAATATAGGITDSGNLSVTGDATFTDTATAGITLGTLQADSNVILTAAGNTLITNDTVLNLEGTVTGTLGATATTGGITDSGAITVTGTTTLAAGANTITLDSDTNDFQGALSVSNTGANAVLIHDANSLAIGTVNVGNNLILNIDRGADDTASLDFSGATITAVGGTITLDGQGTNDTLIATNTDNNWTITALDDGNYDDNNGAGRVFSFTDFANLTGGSTTDDFVINNTFGVSGTIDGGAGVVNDSISVAPYTTAVSVTLASAGANDGMAGTITGVSMFDNIDTLTGTPQIDTLTGFNTTAEFEIDGSNRYCDAVGCGGNVLSFSTIENLTGGAGADTFNITTTHTGNLTGDPAGIGNDGADSFIFNDGGVIGTARVLGNIDGGVFDGAGGPSATSIDTIDFSSSLLALITSTGTGTDNGTTGTILDDPLISAPPDTALITGTYDNINAIIGNGLGSISGPAVETWWNFTKVNAGTFGTSFLTIGDNSFTGIAINAGDAKDVFIFEFAPGGMPAIEVGQITLGINGGAGENILVGSTEGDIFTITGTNTVTVRIGGTTAGFLDTTLTNITKIDSTAEGNVTDATADTFNINSTWGAVGGTTDGSITAGNLNDTFNINANVLGTLTGGAGNDTFTFADTRTVGGNIIGGTGTDVIDWTAYTTARSVILNAVGTNDGFKGPEASINAGAANG
ncbi:MAG: hypothetical protein FVQ79_11860, partial [Planctomycetes bacterium]|nr:hypothetical protein [Planctomycetota bacterium]